MPEHYQYTDGQGHRLSFRPAGETMRPYVTVEAEDTAIGGNIASVWLTLDQAAALDRHLSAGITCTLTDHTGDTLTVTGADDFTTFTVTRQADEDDDRTSVPVVALTGRLPEIRRALTATVEHAQQRTAPSDAELIEHARTVGMVEPEKAPAFAAAYQAEQERRAAEADDERYAPDPITGSAPVRPANRCEQHPAAPRIGGMCGGCTIVPSPRPVPQLADVVEEQPAPGDLFTESAIRRAALLAGADVIENLPQDYECDPGRGDAVKVLRRMAAFHTTAAQPTGLTWEARAAHAVRLYAMTAIERDDLHAENTRLRDRLAELEQGQADADTLAAEFPDTIASLLDELADDIPHRSAPRIAANYLARHRAIVLREAGDHIASLLRDTPEYGPWVKGQLYALAAAPTEEQPATPTVGARYVKRLRPAQIVTVTRVWEAQDGHTAVAYEWRDDRPGQCGSACPIDVFHREYRPEAGR